MKKRVKTSSDRISDLPDHIKQDILSRLDTRDAVRTSVLSRSWRHEWNWLPRLTFKKQVLPKQMEDTSCILSQKRMGYLDFLQRTLLRRSSRASSYLLQKLSLIVPVTGVKLLSSEELKSRIDLLLACAVECNVRKLGVHICSGGNNNRYHLPETVLAACSLTWLKLFNCTFVLNYSSTIIKLSSLQKMSLYLVYVNEPTINRIISSCPALKKLSLVYCLGFRKLEIFGTSASHLEELNVEDSIGLRKVSIDMLHLNSFSMCGWYMRAKIKVAACKNIRRLVLKEVPVTDHRLSFHLDQLLVIEHLQLVKCDLLNHLKISAQRLKHLIVHHCKGLVEAEIDAPNLESFVYWGRRMLSLSLKVPNILQSAEVNLSSQTKDDQWYIRFIVFLNKFNHAVHLTLCVTPDMSVLSIPKDLRLSFDPPLFNVKHVKVEVGYLTNAHYLAELIDTILWLSPHPDSITISSFLDLGFEDIKERVDSEVGDCRCSSIPVKCWRHCLKEVKIDNLDDDEDSANLKVLFENAATLTTIEGLIL